MNIYKVFSVLLLIIFITGCGEDSVTNNNTSNVIYESSELVNYMDVTSDTILLWSGDVNRNDTYRVTCGAFRNDTNVSASIRWGHRIYNAYNGSAGICSPSSMQNAVSGDAPMSGQFYNWDQCEFFVVVTWHSGVTDSTKWLKLSNVKIEKL